MRQCGAPECRQRLRQQFATVDANRNGAIDPGEYGSLVLVKQSGNNAPQMSTFDGNRDGKVNENDLPINTPTHKLGLGLNYSKGKFFSSFFGRFVQAYDFFSGINVAAKTNPTLIYAGSPVYEDRQVGQIGRASW